METQRKIELQAPDDLAYLVANVRRAAAQRIDEAFPAVEGAQDEDELRSRIEELVEKVSRLFFLLSFAPSLLPLHTLLWLCITLLHVAGHVPAPLRVRVSRCGGATLWLGFIDDDGHDDCNHSHHQAVSLWGYMRTMYCLGRPVL